MNKELKDIFEAKMRALYGDEYSLVGSYVNARTQVTIVHNQRGHEFETLPFYFTRGAIKCPTPQCKHRRMLDKYKVGFYKKLIEQDEFDAMDPYDGIDSPMTFKCKKCGCLFTLHKAGRIFDEIKNSHCPDCYSENIRIQEEERYKEKLQSQFGDEFVLYGTYNGADSQVDILHTKCGRVSTYYRSCKVLSDYLSPCKWCSTTKGEKAIMQVLDGIEMEYDFQKTYDDLRGKNTKPLSYDFYIDAYNLLIEYQGEFHDGIPDHMTDEEFELRKLYDDRKRQYAKGHNINLLEIWYWDFDRIDEILTNYFNAADSPDEKVG